MSSYTIKQIEIRVTLAAGSFGGKGTEKVIRGLPMDVTITKTAGEEKPTATATIGGMKYEDMEQLTTLAFKPLQTGKNLISIYAGDEENGLSQVFAGEITSSTADFNRAPDIVFEIEAMAGYYPALTPAGPLAIKGDAPVADIISEQAKLIGYAFTNQGVTDRLRNTVLNGSPIQKAKAAANHVGATLLIDDNQLILLPSTEGRKGTTVFLSKNTGLLGYPKFSSDGIEIDALFNPQFQLDGLVEVESIVPKASGLWRIVKLVHKISANLPKAAPWRSEIDAVYADGSGTSSTAKKSKKK